ncbi:PE domain-containing protein [Prauserella alba]|uniref:PE family protein n=1 Tax=Prauserella alba TaxID=176898 RepID=A0ABP4FQA5_9PSEU|nr:PE domain-containing protein [Prauserella alba]MCP2183271.1 PE family protein [Prauserella alba]
MPSEVSESRFGGPVSAEAAFASADTAFAAGSNGGNDGGADTESGNAQGGPFGGSDITPGGGLFPSVPSAGDIDVAPDKVADAARIIEAQADALDEKLSEQLNSLRIKAPAEDIVSRHAVEAWNDVVSSPEDSYAAHARAYVEDLRSLATQLRRAGEKYSESDEEKADALGGGRGLPG